MTTTAARAEAASVEGFKPWTRPEMAARLARDIPEGWCVNLGIGIPLLVSNFVKGREVIFQSENGIIGMGGLQKPDELEPWLVNAGKQNVNLVTGASIVHHADSFAIIRSGRIDVTVLGAYEVASTGDFANWKVKGAKGGGIGGAMDLAACAKNVFIIMEHATRNGSPRLLDACTIPVTARGAATLVVTNLGLFKPAGDAFELLEIAPGVSVEEIKAATGAPVKVPADLKPVRLV